MEKPFAQRLLDAQHRSGGLLCVGLDPDLSKLPHDLINDATPILAFNRRIIDATADIAAAYKPQIAFYSAVAAEDQLRASIDYIRERAPHALVLLDSKRNDIANTAEAYAREAFERYAVDAVTVNPYLGEDSVRPFLAHAHRAAIVLCRTSNPGARDFQDLLVEGQPLYRHVAARAAQWNELNNVLLVVGATYPSEMAALRLAHPDIPFLVPGIGAQGGDLEAMLEAGLDARGAGLLINSARGINYANGGTASGIRAAAVDLHTAINRTRSVREHRDLETVGNFKTRS